MATTYLRLFDPTQQFQLKSGAINTAGLLRVYLNGTDDLADIYDENGNLIDSDTDSTDECLCTFTPRWTGQFKIKIKNRGNVYNEYQITTSAW